MVSPHLDATGIHLLKRILKSLRGQPYQGAGAVSNLEAAPGKMPAGSSLIQDVDRASIRLVQSG
jgi:hypothetical protein